MVTQRNQNYHQHDNVEIHAWSFSISRSSEELCKNDSPRFQNLGHYTVMLVNNSIRNSTQQYQWAQTEQ